MKQIVVQPSLVAWARGFLESELAALADRFPVLDGVQVVSGEPDVSAREWPEKLVIVAGELSGDRDHVMSEASLRVSVVAGVKEDPGLANAIASVVHGVMRTAARATAGNPVAEVLSARGPMWADEAQFRARVLSTFELALVGDVIDV